MHKLFLKQKQNGGIIDLEVTNKCSCVICVTVTSNVDLVGFATFIHQKGSEDCQYMTPSFQTN